MSDKYSQVYIMFVLFGLFLGSLAPVAFGSRGASESHDSEKRGG